MIGTVVVWGACGLLAAATVCDLRARRIPNAIPLALLALFAVHAAAGGTEALWRHLVIGTVLLAAGFVLYLRGSFGAGDVKLAAVAGMWIGPTHLSLFLLGLGACALALVLLALLPFDRMRRTRDTLPFAVATAPPAAAVMILQASPSWYP